MGNHDQATPGIVTIASYEDLQLCPQSSDWYEITTLPGDDITFEVSRADGGDIFAIDMNLWLGNAFVDFGINSDGKVVIQRQFSTVETYQLEVVSDEPTTYDLSLSLLF